MDYEAELKRIREKNTVKQVDAEAERKARIEQDQQREREANAIFDPLRARVIDAARKMQATGVKQMITTDTSAAGQRDPQHIQVNFGADSVKLMIYDWGEDYIFTQTSDDRDINFPKTEKGLDLAVQHVQEWLVRKADES